MRSVYNPWQPEQTRHTADLTIAGNGTGGGTLQGTIEGVAVSLATTGAETPTVAAGKLKAAADVALAAAGVTNVTITDHGDGSLQVARDDKLPIFVEVLTADATQSISASSWFHSQRQLDGATVKLDGAQTSRADSAGNVTGETDRFPLVSFHLRFFNGTAGAKSLRWRVDVYSPVFGWFEHPDIGTRLLSNAGASWVDDVVQLFAEGWNRARIVLVDDNAGGNLAGVGVHADGRVQAG